MPPWPPGAPHQPPMTPNQVSWTHWTLKITSPAFQIIRRPIKCHCWSFDLDPLGPLGLGLWDPVGLPIDPLRPLNSPRVDLADLSSPVWSCFLLPRKKICPLQLRTAQTTLTSSPLSRKRSNPNSFWLFLLSTIFMNIWTLVSAGREKGANYV